MAKFGAEEAGYDPFNKISNSLAALSKPPAIPKPEEPSKESSPPEIESKPVAQEQIRPSIPDSGGGGLGNSSRRQEHQSKPMDSSLTLSVMKRFKTTTSDGLRIDQSALQLSVKLGVGVDVSKITRALWEVYLTHEDEILRSVQPGAVDRRPANRDAVGMAEFEKQLTKTIEEGLLMASMRSRRDR